MAAEVAQSVEHAAARMRRHEDVELAVGGAGDDRGRQRRVAAARDRQVTAVRLQQLGLLGEPEPEHQADQLPTLERARDVPGFVLDEDFLYPEAACQFPRSNQGRLSQAGAVDLGHGSVEVPQLIDEVGIAQAPSEGGAITVEECPVAQQRVRLVAVEAGTEVDSSGIVDREDTPDDMVAVVGVGVRATERPRIVGRRLETAAGADELRPDDRHLRLAIRRTNTRPGR